MNTFGGFDLFSPSTWFGDDNTASSTGGSSFTGASNDFFGFNLPDFNDVVGGVSDSQLNQWNNYWDKGGVMGADLTGTTGTSGTTSGDIFSGIGDFLNTTLSALPGLAQTGLGIYANVQAIINAQNPSDKIVTLPGSKTPVIERTQGGATTYIPFATAYPGLVPQVNQAQQSAQWIPFAFAGILGLGLIFILKKK
jgi:hypothetical protein